MAITLRFIHVIFILALPVCLVGQHKGLEKLLKTEAVIPEVVQYNPGITTFFEITDIQAAYMNGIAQHLIKNKKGLFLLPDGTGRVYKVEQIDNRLALIRQDSTLFFGYNFGFFPFTYHDTLYSFGGYGYWRFNGHLRTFVPTKGGWELENLNREIPFTRVGYAASPKWFNPRKGKLWIGFSTDSKEGIKKDSETFKNIKDSVYVLDLNTKQWKNLGGLSKEARDIANPPVNCNLGSSPWGQLIHDPTKSAIYLFDFNNNKIFSLRKEKVRAITQLLESGSILYFSDSTLFIGLHSRPLDSLLLSKRNFTPTNSFIYHPAGVTPIQKLSPTNNNLLFGLIAIVVASGVGYLYYRKRKQRTAPAQDAPTGNAVRIFEDKEIEIIKLIMAKSAKGLGTSIDELNKNLGVAQKNAEIQKKQRSETLIAINRKWRFKNNNQQLLIKKRRVEHDKRSFEYYIDYENLQKVNELLITISL